MIRGVSCPPAIWIATSSEPNVNTRNDSASVMIVWYIACAPETPSSAICHPSQASMRCTMGAVTSSIAIAMIGTVHSADLR